MTAMELDLWLCGALVARTASQNRGAKFRIVYDETVAAEVRSRAAL
jgi:hypothetical protein